MKKRLTVLAALLTCSTLMGSVHVYAEENEKNVVETVYGKVQGINSTDENYQEVVEFRGIPYAAPPVDDLRWKPPVDPECRYWAEQRWNRIKRIFITMEFLK